MIKLTEKNMHKWPFWSRRGKFVFSLASGLFYSIFIFTGTLFLKWGLDKDNTSIVQESLGLALGGFLFFYLKSIGWWYANELKYRRWTTKEKLNE